MAKLSRTGKKKKPLYGPHGSLTPPEEKAGEGKVAIKVSEIKEKSKRLDQMALFVLFIALAIILVKGRMDPRLMEYKLWITSAYVLTIISGVFTFLSRKLQNAVRKRGSITAFMIIGIGIFGIFYTWFII